jgi:Domain of unknown function DUF302
VAAALIADTAAPSWHEAYPQLPFVFAGDDADCVAYLMGNHVTAERMFRHDPRAMLYAPLRTMIWEDSTGGAWFTVDQPSTQFGSLGIPEVSKVGVELDRELAALLQALDVDVPEALLQS